jgi:hypothetical protein
MPQFKVFYDFDGYGQAMIEADSREEAEQRFYDGAFVEACDRPAGRNYTVVDIEDMECVPF